MQQVLLAIHLMLAVALIGVVLLQKSEGGGLGIGGGGGGMSGFMTGRGTANLLTRLTAGLAASFFATSLLLALLASGTGPQRSILETSTPAPQEQPQPAQAPAPAAPAAPANQQPSSPSVPLGQ